MGATKIRLSAEEMDLLLRSDWILTKNSIIQKAKHLLEDIQTGQQDILANHSTWLPEEVYKTSAKISKGENYQGLPYLILDQPRYFSRDNIFAIRSFFWWGHFFSSTLHLSGSYKSFYEENIITAFDILHEAGFFVCINPGQWEHHFEEGNFVSLNNITGKQFGDIIRNNMFIKLSKKISLSQWDIAEEMFAGIFSKYLSVLGKKGLESEIRN